ncbi:hypothetical protein PF003_g23162 [Phytophthora fragariae]|nr:hypothetical protein PF003_g23162 [Phytophthora fragariae]
MVRSPNRAQRTQEEKDNDARVHWDRSLYEEEKRQQNLARFQLTAPQNDSADEGGGLCSMYDRAGGRPRPENVQLLAWGPSR